MTHRLPSPRQYPDLQHQQDLSRLGEEITELAAHIHAATYQLLELIRIFDEEQGWGGDGVMSCAHWLNWKAAYWFTYPLEGGAREWYLAMGDISGDRVDFTVYQTENGVFDQVSPVKTNAVGSATLHFSSCSQASWTYTIETDGISGEIPLQRIAPDYYCEEFLAMANTEAVSRSNAWVDIRGEWLFEGCVNLENSDSHGNEQFIFTDTTVSLRIDRYSQPNCQGVFTQQVLNLEMQRVDKTLALLGGSEVIANRFVMTDATSGAEIRQLIYVDDSGPVQLLAHGLLGTTTDSEGFPAELPELFFARVTGNP